MALEDGHLDGALVVRDARSIPPRGCSLIARSSVVLALGLGAKNHQYTNALLIEALQGKAEGAVRELNFILRPANDPLQMIVSSLDVGLKSAFERALEERTWPI